MDQQFYDKGKSLSTGRKGERDDQVPYSMRK